MCRSQFSLTSVTAQITRADRSLVNDFVNENPTQQIHQCCAALYESDIARLLLGDSFHPGGAETTRRLGQLMGLSASSCVLDAACGRGDSALVLAQTFGARVIGVDLSAKNVAGARVAAQQQGLGHRVEFIAGDVASMGLAAGSVDAVVCECAFCLFPDKKAAALEFARVLKPGGVLGLSDLTRTGPVPPDLQGLLAWVACVADAQPVAEYCECLRGAGFQIGALESANAALASLIRQVGLRILSAQVMVALKRLELPGIDLDAANGFCKAALAAAESGQLGYVLMTGITVPAQAA